MSSSSIKKSKKSKKEKQNKTDNVFLYALFNIRNIVMDMLSDRGYTESIKKNYSDITFDEFEKLYTEQNINIYAYKTENDITTQCIVYFVDPNSMAGKNKQQFGVLASSIEKTFAKDSNINLIFIADDKEVNPQMSNIEKYVSSYNLTYNEINPSEYRMIAELFNYSAVSINITKHDLVPIHILLKDEEVEAVLREKSVGKNNLPKIEDTDPICKYYGGKIGDVFKIFRKSPTTGISPPVYRVVVKGA